MEPHDLPPAPVTQSDPSPPGPAAVTDPTAAAASDVPTRDPRYPLTVIYCPICSLPPELHEYHSKNQFEKCSDWLRKHTPTLFPDRFPEEAAAATAAEASDAPPPSELSEDKSVKVAVPIEQKTSGGKKKKAPAEVVLMLGQRKGKKQVTIVYGLDLFGVKLKDATKAAKRKFATGSSLAIVCHIFLTSHIYPHPSLPSLQPRTTFFFHMLTVLVFS